MLPIIRILLPTNDGICGASAPLWIV